MLLQRVIVDVDEALEGGMVVALAELDKETAAQACGVCGVRDDDLAHTVLCDQCESPFHMCVGRGMDIHIIIYFDDVGSAWVGRCCRRGSGFASTARSRIG